MRASGPKWEYCGAQLAGDAAEEQTEQTWAGGGREEAEFASTFKTSSSVDGNVQHFEAVESHGGKALFLRF